MSVYLWDIRNGRATLLPRPTVVVIASCFFTRDARIMRAVLVQWLSLAISKSNYILEPSCDTIIAQTIESEGIHHQDYYPVLAITHRHRRHHHHVHPSSNTSHDTPPSHCPSSDKCA
jgi:hypothetical protein